MCSRNQCGSIWSALTLVLLCGTLAVPWYWETRRVMVGEKELCEVDVLTSWNTEYCSIGPANSTCAKLQNILCDKESYSWRSHGECAGEKCQSRAETYDISLYLLVASVFSMAVITLGFFIRCCCPAPGKSYLMIMVALIGLVTLIVALALFAHQLPESYKHDYGGKCPSEDIPSSLAFADGPCNSFWGKYSFTSGIIETEYDRFWLPLGWCVGAAAVPFYLIVLCLSCLRGKERRYDSGVQGLDYKLHQEAQTFV